MRLLKKPEPPKVFPGPGGAPTICIPTKNPLSYMIHGVVCEDDPKFSMSPAYYRKIWWRLFKSKHGLHNIWPDFKCGCSRRFFRPWKNYGCMADCPKHAGTLYEIWKEVQQEREKKKEIT